MKNFLEEMRILKNEPRRYLYFLPYNQKFYASKYILEFCELVYEKNN